MVTSETCFSVKNFGNSILFLSNEVLEIREYSLSGIILEVKDKGGKRFEEERGGCLNYVRVMSVLCPKCPCYVCHKLCQKLSLKSEFHLLKIQI